MDKAEIIQLIRDYLGFHKSLTEAIIFRHMNSFQQDMERPHGRLPLPWFLFNPSRELFTTQGIDYIDLPAEFIQQDDEEEWHPYLALEDERAYLEKDINQTPYWGTPTRYELLGGKLYVAPTPDDEYKIIFPHFSRSAKLSTAGTSPWFEHFPNLVIAATALSLASALRDDRGIQLINPRYSAERDNYSTTVEAWKHHMRQYTFGPE